MTKLRKALLLLFSLATGLTALFSGGLLLRQYAARLLPPAGRVEANFPAQASIGQPESQPAQTLNPEANTADPPTAVFSNPTRPTKSLPPLPTPTSAWMTYDGISLPGEKMEIWVRPTCEAFTIQLPLFTVHPWTNEVFSDGTFAVGADNAVAWEHLGYLGLWIHSGLDWLGTPQAAFPLHDYLERGADGEVRRPDEFEAALRNCLLGSLARVSTASGSSLSRVTAAVRVPSPGVEELAGHVMDLVPYLAETYPGNGFEDLTSPALLLYFCGRRLSTEPKNPNAEFWAQARIIIALEPAN